MAEPHPLGPAAVGQPWRPRARWATPAAVKSWDVITADRPHHYDLIVARYTNVRAYQR
jgi:hypothetical protein